MRQLGRKMRLKACRLTVRTHHLSHPEAGYHVILQQNRARLDVSLDYPAVWTTLVQMQETTVQTLNTKNLKIEEKFHNTQVW